MILTHLPKDVVITNIGDHHLELLDILKLALCCKTMYGWLHHFFDMVPEMQKKWTNTRCYLESIRMKNYKLYMHLDKKWRFDPWGYEQKFWWMCIRNDIDSVKEYLKQYEQYDVEDMAEIQQGIMFSIVHGSWACFDYLKTKFNYELDHIFGKISSDISTRNLKDYMVEYNKRNLHLLRQHRELMMAKALEFDDYEMFSQNYDKTKDHRKSDTWRYLSMQYLIFCDDPRFKDLFEDLIGPKVISEIYLRGGRCNILAGNHYFKKVISDKIKKNRQKKNIIGEKGMKFKLELLPKLIEHK